MRNESFWKDRSSECYHPDTITSWFSIATGLLGYTWFLGFMGFVGYYKQSTRIKGMKADEAMKRKSVQICSIRVLIAPCAFRMRNLLSRGKLLFRVISFADWT